MRLSTAFPQGAQLGPRSRREAKGLARMLAGLCQTICSAAMGLARTMERSDDAKHELVKQVVQTCQEAIATALAQPSHAIGLAQVLGEALTSLQVVQKEVAKGEAGEQGSRGGYYFLVCEPVHTSWRARCASNCSKDLNADFRCLCHKDPDCSVGGPAHRIKSRENDSFTFGTLIRDCSCAAKSRGR